jgi:hypothetical protein
MKPRRIVRSYATFYRGIAGAKRGALERFVARLAAGPSG